MTTTTPNPLSPPTGQDTATTRRSRSRSRVRTPTPRRPHPAPPHAAAQAPPPTPSNGRRVTGHVGSSSLLHGRRRISSSCRPARIRIILSYISVVPRSQVTLPRAPGAKSNTLRRSAAAVCSFGILNFDSLSRCFIFFFSSSSRSFSSVNW